MHLNERIVKLQDMELDARRKLVFEWIKTNVISLVEFHHICDKVVISNIV